MTRAKRCCTPCPNPCPHAWPARAGQQRQGASSSRLPRQLRLGGVLTDSLGRGQPLTCWPRSRRPAHQSRRRDRCFGHCADAESAVRPDRLHPSDQRRTRRLARRRLAPGGGAVCDHRGASARSRPPISGSPRGRARPIMPASAFAVVSIRRSTAAAAVSGIGISRAAASIGRIPCTTCSA